MGSSHVPARIIFLWKKIKDKEVSAILSFFICKNKNNNIQLGLLSLELNDKNQQKGLTEVKIQKFS